MNFLIIIDNQDFPKILYCIPTELFRHHREEIEVRLDY